MQYSALLSIGLELLYLLIINKILFVIIIGNFFEVNE